MANPSDAVVGSLVRLRSGGPVMTVVDVAFDEEEGRGAPVCGWHGDGGAFTRLRLEYNVLDVVQLTPATDPDASEPTDAAAHARILDVVDGGEILN